MKRYNNKHWLKEKEYYSLKLLYYDFYYLTGSSIESELKRRLYSTYYNKYLGFYNTAPKHYRKFLNRRQRFKSKSALRAILNGENIEFDDNYKDCNWFW